MHRTLGKPEQNIFSALVLNRSLELSLALWRSRENSCILW